jgi:hypothetical protein
MFELRQVLGAVVLHRFGLAPKTLPVSKAAQQRRTPRRYRDFEATRDTSAPTVLGNMPVRGLFEALAEYKRRVAGV